MVRSKKGFGIVAMVCCTLVLVVISSFNSPAHHERTQLLNVNSASSKIGLPASSPLHPIFVSVTEMNHNQQDQTLEISCKIFTDDFETVLTKTTGAKIDLFTPKDTALTGKRISDYIGKHLIVKIDGKPVQLNFIGFERESDAVWSYFEVTRVTPVPKTVSVMNNLLYDNFKEQINLLHVTVGGKRKSTKLDNPEANADFSF